MTKNARKIVNPNSQRVDDTQESAESVDFSELNKPPKGERLEQLVEQVTEDLKLTHTRTGRGADGGRDLIVYEHFRGPLSSQRLKWLVVCKDYSESNKAVSESDIGSISDRLSQHKCDGIMIVTTTTISSGLQNLLESLDKEHDGSFPVLVINGSKLRRMLLQPVHRETLKNFFPKSYKKVAQLDTVRGLASALAERLPKPYADRILDIAEQFESVQTVEFGDIWPFGGDTADLINLILIELQTGGNSLSPLRNSESLEADAFEALAEGLVVIDRALAFEFLKSVVERSSSEERRYLGFRILRDEFELNAVQYIQFATHLNRDDLLDLFEGEITQFVDNSIMNNEEGQDIWSEILMLSTSSSIEELLVEDLEIRPNGEDQLDFDGNLSIEVELWYGDSQDNVTGSCSLPGKFSGYIDATGIFLVAASVDTSSFYK